MSKYDSQTYDFLVNLGAALGEGLQDIGTHTAKAAAQANNVSAQAQSAQGAFNQASANQGLILYACRKRMTKSARLSLI